MSNIGLIISREYSSRVKKKSFVIMTLLGPVLIAGFFLLIGWMATRGADTKQVAILDEAKQFQSAFVNSDETEYTQFAGSLEEAKKAVLDGQFDGLLFIPSFEIEQPKGVTYFAPNNPSISLVSRFSSTIEAQIEQIKLKNSGISQEMLDALKADVDVSTINLTSTGDEKESSSIGSSAIGYISSLLIYMFIFIYGAQCMRGVTEEKTTRIVEVVIASVKPFHLMLGKIIGIAGVGLTQFVLWIILTAAISSIGGGLLLGDSMKAQQQQTEQLGIPQDEVSKEMEDNLLAKVTGAMASIDIPKVIIAFLFYFLTGYLLYGALFAAIGSAVDSDADAQQFMFPITVPLIASIVSLSAVLNDPNGSLAFWMSMIPFTSPVVMMMRVPFGVPNWQLILSMVLMIGGFLFTTWLASRIYRVGILMHGTKVNYKVLAKWFMMKN